MIKKWSYFCILRKNQYNSSTLQFYYNIMKHNSGFIVAQKSKFVQDGYNRALDKIERGEKLPENYVEEFDKNYFRKNYNIWSKK